MIDLLAAIRSVHFAATLLIGGMFAFALFLGEPVVAGPRRDSGTSSHQFERWWVNVVGCGLIAGLVSGVCWFIVQAALMSGRFQIVVLDPTILGVVGRETQFGRIWILRLALLLLLALWVWFWRLKRAELKGLLLLGGLLSVALVSSLAGTGHAVATEGQAGLVHLAADSIHLVAAAAWLGSLIPLSYVLHRAHSGQNAFWIALAQASTRRFSVFGPICVAALVLTGLVNTWFLVGTFPRLVGTPYGYLLLLKLGLIVAIVGIAAANRLRLTPGILGRRSGIKPREAVKSLRRNVIIETSLGAIVLVVVGRLGIGVPAMHTQPLWPFPFRPSFEAVADDLALRLALATAGIVLILGVSAIAYSLVRARHRKWMAPAGVAALGAGLVLAWNVLAVPAYPTSFADSPVSYAVQPIAHGARIYGDHCAVCHGARGYGDGPAAALFPILPADLASDRLLRHRDGELFWWVTHGIENTPMPGFSDTLGEMDRWEVVAFLRAQAEAEASISLGPEIGPSPTLAAPDFTFEIDNQPQDNLLSQRSRAAILLVLYTLPGSLPRLQQLEEARAELERRGARIIAAPMGEMGMSGPIAAAPNPDLITAYMLYYRTERIADRSSAPHHIEFLIDRDGYIRARSIPDGASGWGTLSTLLVELDRLSHETPRTQAPTLGAHTH